MLSGNFIGYQAYRSAFILRCDCFIVLFGIHMDYSFVLHTDHFQFYLEDLAIKHDTSLLWGHGIDSLLQTLDGLLAVGTARWGLNTPVSIEVHHQRPPDQNETTWDYVREAHLRTISGRLHLTTPEGDNNQAPSIPLTSGNYVVRVYYVNLDLVDDELDTHGPDQYKVILWPETQLLISSEKSNRVYQEQADGTAMR